MLIEKSKPRGPKDKDCKPSSFRFDDETKRRLAAVSLYSGKKQTVIMETLIDKAYEEIQKNFPAELKKIEKGMGE